MPFEHGDFQKGGAGISKGCVIRFVCNIAKGKSLVKRELAANSKHQGISHLLPRLGATHVSKVEHSALLDDI